TKTESVEILKRDNVLALIEETKLLERWDAERGLLLRLKDRAVGVFTGPVSEQDRIRAVVGVVEKRVMVSADDTTITITVDWPNAKTAHHLAHPPTPHFP